MSDGFWIQFFGFLGLIVTQLFLLWSARDAKKIAAKNAKAATITRAKNTATIENVERKIEVVHKATNSLVDRLVKSTETEALARGKEEQRTKPISGEFPA